MRNQQTIQQALELLKQETATEMGIELGAETSSKLNGAVGGRVTQKLITLGKLQLEEMVEKQGIGNVELTQHINSQDTPQSTQQELH